MTSTTRWRRAWRALISDPHTPARYAAMATAETEMGREAAKRHRPRGEAADAAAWHADGVWAWEGLHLALTGQRQALAAHTATRPAWTGPGRALAAVTNDQPTPARLRALHSALIDAGAACEGIDPIVDLADHLDTPTSLVGQWVRLARDGGRPPHVGMLTRADPMPDHPGLWQWALHTPTGYMVGGPNLPIEALTREHTDDIARARRQLSRRLRADRALLADLVSHDEPVGAVARAVADLENLQEALNTQLST